ncbi:T-complex protein 11-domain-containing protein [Crucibulum laeve]|uniref:T-complex protein 11-domain-containing protein n=1 Tax=Crucibulum laeve TaxID=68775 RepID=A0A5C3M5F3_9AGAR|nr:T-complex protein 11-domain-containing protein [Crucibulum laeve]
MDDLAHEFPLNHRKRKADSSDDRQEPSSSSAEQAVSSQDSLLVDNTAAGPSNAPRQPWLASDAGDALWSSPSSPQVSSPLSSQALSSYTDNTAKRPRLDRVVPPPHPSGRRMSKHFIRKATPSKSPTVRHGSDIEDIGIVSTADPGPSTGSLLRPRSSKSLSRPTLPTLRVPRLLPQVDLSSPYLPSLQPLINRQTLKELDLDAILRNPQLRHDLLFDPGLQFRPSGSRRKRDLAEKYWAAITQEVESGCTCVSFDMRGKPCPAVCVCAVFPTPPTHPVVYSPSSDGFTLRMPTRIRSLLSEFLEVLLLVIQPLSTISGIYVNAAKFKEQMQEHSAQATYIRSVFDPAFIEQELKRGLYDPSGLFRTIGATLKGHCAPMRDAAVESMVQAAQVCAPGGSGSKADAVKAVRMCMEILELMKLDIANHQLQTLRPFLIRTAGQFELKSLKSRVGINGSLHLTREWLHSSHNFLMSRSSAIAHPLYPTGHFIYKSLPRNTQLYFAALKGTVDLVFNPPQITSASTPVTATPSVSPTSPTSAQPFSAFPETFYLDNSRVLSLGSDAADATAMYMFLLLYRQLVFSEGSDPAQDPPKVDESDLVRLKCEIRDIASAKLGICFWVNSSDRGELKLDIKDIEKWRDMKQDIVLQVARRAKEVRCRAGHPSVTSDAPDERMLNLAQRWADSNIQSGSTLSVMLHERLREVVFNTVASHAYPGPSGKISKVVYPPPEKGDSSLGLPGGNATGMEQLADEIRSLSDKISHLSVIHLNAYLPMYEKEGFLQS